MLILKLKYRREIINKLSKFLWKWFSEQLHSLSLCLHFSCPWVEVVSVKNSFHFNFFLCQTFYSSIWLTCMKIMLQLKKIGNLWMSFHISTPFTDLKIQFDQKHPYEVNSIEIKKNMVRGFPRCTSWMKIRIHLVHPLEKLLVREETKKQRMWPECTESCQQEYSPSDSGYQSCPRAAALQSKSSDQNKKIMTDHQLCWELSDASATDLAPVSLQTWSLHSTETDLIGILGCITLKEIYLRFVSSTESNILRADLQAEKKSWPINTWKNMFDIINQLWSTNQNYIEILFHPSQKDCHQEKEQ